MKHYPHLLSPFPPNLFSLLLNKFGGGRGEKMCLVASFCLFMSWFFVFFFLVFMFNCFLVDFVFIESVSFGLLS